MKKQDFKTIFGSHIRTLRKKAGFTLEELAWRAQIHPNYLGEVERGAQNISLDNMRKIAEGLNTQISDLFAVNQLCESKDELVRSLTPLIMSLQRNTQPDREYIIAQACSLSVRLRSSKAAESSRKPNPQQDEKRQQR